MGASKYLFEPKKNVVFDRLVFCQAIQRKNEPLINFVTRLGTTFEFANQNTEIEKELISAHIIAYAVFYCKNPILKVVEKVQAMEIEMQASMARLKVTQDQYGFHSLKYCFAVEDQPILEIRIINIAKGKTCQECGRKNILWLFANQERVRIFLLTFFDTSPTSFVLLFPFRLLLVLSSSYIFPCKSWYFALLNI